MGEKPDVVVHLQLESLEGFVLQEGLIQQAFLHSSYCMENPSSAWANPYLECNQRLEFFGDAILGFLTAERLFRTHPQAQEGEMTRKRAALVCEKSLAAAAEALGLGKYMKLGRSITSADGLIQPSVLADAFEALLGALYLCGASLPALEVFIFRAFENSRHLLVEDTDEDYRGQLQAWVQKTKGKKLSYAVLEEKGPDHQKMFLAAVYVDGKELGRSWGKSKQEAQKQAAKNALVSLRIEAPAGMDTGE